MSSRIGRYTLHDEIASGGMATVHLGMLRGPAGFSRTVAIKRVHPHLAAGGELAAALLDEGRVSARIQHPFVVQSVDVVAADGELAIVMEYVHGVALSTLIRRAVERDTPIEPRVAATIVAQVLRGLHAAHEVTDEDGRRLELVHRDVSPQNVLVGVDGVARVLDFGIAKALGRASTTREGAVKGKIGYMSPEQVGGGEVDRRTDVFAAAIVLWELLMRRRLFDGVDSKDVFAKVMRCEVASPRSLGSPIDAELEAIVMRGLAREPDDRFATAAEMAHALEHWGPLAPPSQVGALVDALYGEELAKRRARIAAIERGDAEAAPPTIERHGDETKAATVSSVVTSPPEPKRGRALLMLAGAVAVVLPTALLVALRSRPGVTAAVAPTATAPPIASSVPVIEPAPSAPVASAVVTVVTSASARPPARRPAAHPQPDCSDPYVLDARGKKRYRRECLTE